MAETLSRRRRWFFTLAYLCLMGTCCLVALELVARWLYPGDSFGIYATQELDFDPLVGWRGRRGFDRSIPHGRYPLPVRVAINADGFRDEPWDQKLARARRTRARKLLLLGDSLLYGWANPEDGRLGEQLQALYAQRGRPLEVFNAGIPGYGPPHQLRLLPELLERIEPDDVVLVFCVNDYGDSALPYDYRYPLRVYQPFYDEQGELLFNARVPRRPSLRMRDTPLGRLRLWRALDTLDALMGDARYARHGIPNARTPGIKLELLGDFFYDRALQQRFPYVERSVLAVYGKMAAAARAHGARFRLVPSIEFIPPDWQSFESRMRAKLEAQGVNYVPAPPHLTLYSRWFPTWRDGHPNFVWAWVLAARLFATLEGQPLGGSLAGLPQLAWLPARLALEDEPGVARSLALEWGPLQDGRRRLDGIAAALLRHPEPGRPVTLRVRGWAPAETTVAVTTPEQPAACRLTFGPLERTLTCDLPGPHGRPVVFVLFEPAAPGQAALSLVEATVAQGALRTASPPAAAAPAGRPGRSSTR